MDEAESLNASLKERKNEAEKNQEEGGSSLKELKSRGQFDGSKMETFEEQLNKANDEYESNTIKIDEVS